MTFAESLQSFSPAHILGALPGVSISTVAAWKAGSRKPPIWAQPLILGALGKPAVVEPAKPAAKPARPAISRSASRDENAELARLLQPQFRKAGRL